MRHIRRLIQGQPDSLMRVLSDLMSSHTAVRAVSTEPKLMQRAMLFL
jgi:hypothetical protein